MNALFYTIFLCCSLLAIAKRSRSFGPDFLIVLANWKRPQYLFLLILLLYTIVFILMNGHTGSIPVEKFATPKFFPESSLFLAFFYYVLALASAEDS